MFCTFVYKISRIKSLATEKNYEKVSELTPQNLRKVKERSISQVRPLILSPLSDQPTPNFDKKHSERLIPRRNSFQRLPSLKDLQSEFKQIEAQEEIAISLVLKDFFPNNFSLLD
jgi:hypothetical protein